MSKPTTKETLHSCPQCGQAGFTASGLRTHQKSKTCKERSKALAKADPVHLKEFDQARRYVSDIRELGRKAQHLSLLLGFELNKQKAALGIKRGGDQKSEESKTLGASLIPWHDLVKQQTGLSHDACDRWMTIAKGASKSLPILMSKDVLEKPFSELPEKRQEEVMKILHKAVDGQTMHEMMVGFGVWKEKKPHGPPKPTKQSAANRSANADDEVLTQAELMELAKGHAVTIEDITLAGAFKALDTDHLSSFENLASKLLSEITTELKSRKAAK